MTSLYQLTNDMKELDDLLADADPNDPGIEAAIQQALFLHDEREKKVDAYCSLIAEISARGAARKAEGQRLLKSAEVAENAVKRLKTRLLESFKTLDIKRLETERFTVSVANNGGVVPLILAPDLDPESLPAQFKKIITTPDNEAIRTSLEAKEELPFAKLGERGQHVRIK